MGKIFIYGAIGYEVDAKTIVQEINNTPEGETIEVYINSPGGDVYDGLSIYNALQRRKSNLKTYIDGLAYSAASWLALVPSPENRFMSTAAQFGIHRAANFAGGNQKDLQRQIEILESIDKIQVEIYSKATGLKEDYITEIMDMDKPLSFKESQAFGFNEYEPEKVAALFNINNNMDLLEKLKNQLNASKQEPGEELKEEVKAEIKEEVKASKTPAEALSANFAKKEDLLAFQKQFEPLVYALTDYIKEAPRLEDMEAMAKKATNEAMKALLSDLQSSGEVPTAQEKDFEDLKAQEQIQDLKPDKATFKDIFNTKKAVE